MYCKYDCKYFEKIFLREIDKTFLSTQCLYRNNKYKERRFYFILFYTFKHSGVPEMDWRKVT